MNFKHIEIISEIVAPESDSNHTLENTFIFFLLFVHPFSTEVDFGLKMDNSLKRMLGPLLNTQ